MRHRNRRAFTLIELLIVVAIIGILGAIAVPNFLEAQTRSKVSRVMNDLRTLSVAAEAYYTDHNSYPPNSNGPIGGPHPGGSTVLFIVPLSTPVAYVQRALYEDPFGNSEFELTQIGEKSIYFYINTSSNDILAVATIQAAFPSEPDKRALAYEWRYYIASAGPDRIFEVQIYQQQGFGNGYVPDIQARVNGMGAIYDPTNGKIGRAHV